MLLFQLILGTFVLAAVAPLIHRFLPRATPYIMAAMPGALFLQGLFLVPAVQNGAVMTVERSWVPSMGISATLMVDGLGVLFLLLISGIGLLVVVYGGTYLKGHPAAGRFFAFFQLFLGSMVGVTVAGNLILLFAFWELTGISSYFLIGLNSERAEARAAALRALLVTGAGGLALLTGFLLLGLAAGSFELSRLLAESPNLRTHPAYLPILLLVLFGAFTKSAQFPFHFWLPGAMEAPTPVSAYLHSATMVKAGVFLLARLNPELGGTPEWHYLVGGAGAATMVLGAVLSFRQDDLKLILAYTTVSALGMLVLLIGFSTELSIKAAMVFLVVHALYKGSLFLVAGSVDHETGTRNVERLGGLRRVMPWTATAAVLAGLSMAGLPPLLGFISKELLYEAKIQAPLLAPLFTGAGVLTNVIVAAVAGLIVVRPFFGPLRAERPPGSVHEAPLPMLAGPLVLSGLGVLIGLFPDVIDSALLTPAVSAAHAEATSVRLSLWHGINPVLLLSVLTIVSALALFTQHRSLRALLPRFRLPVTATAEGLYDAGLSGLKTVAQRMTELLQNGYLRVYIGVVLAATIALAGFPLLMNGVSVSAPGDMLPHELIVVALMAAGALLATMTRSRFTAILALGFVGYGIALLFALFGAPDLAMTQFAVETLTLLIFVLVVHRLPAFSDYSSGRSRARDAVVAAAGGIVMAAIVLLAAELQLDGSVADFFAAASLAEAKGRNVVNVILVDFRALDTLGEITVIGVAALGVFALLRLVLRNDSGHGPEERRGR